MTGSRRKIRTMEQEERRKHRRLLHELVGKTGMWPLDAPGMPYPGPDFIRAAKGMGDDTILEKKGQKLFLIKAGETLSDLYRRALREPGFTLSVQVKPGYDATVEFIPGHIWGQNRDAWAESMVNRNIEAVDIAVDGPHPADVMVIGKMPWRDEVRERRNLVGASGEVLTHLIKTCHIKGAAKWYITNLCKFMPPDETTRIMAGWLADCRPLLYMELRIVRPKYILCLGADASKALLGTKFNVTYMDGRVVPFTFPIHPSTDYEPATHTCKVMTVLHPAEAAREAPKARQIERGLGRFALLTMGTNFDKAEEDLDHRVIDTYEEAVEWVEEVNYFFADKPHKERLVAWDAEWDGSHPINPGAYLRTIQASWAPKHAVCFKLTHAGGKRAFFDSNGKPAVKRLMKLLTEFASDKRAVGHFLVADLEWMHHYGFDPIAKCAVPLDPKNGKSAWQRLRDGEGWLDTGMMAHAIEETASFGLELLAMRYTTVPRYDIALDDWKKKEKTDRLRKGLPAMTGYGDAPESILHPYALYDSDSDLRLALALLPLLDCDYEGNCCWEPFWESMIAQPVILDMHKNGILVDRERIDRLTESFLEARSNQEEEIKAWARWPEFNIRSTVQVREFLFGEQLSGKVDINGRSLKSRPTGAISLYVEPLLDTSKPPRRWEDIKAKHQERQATAGTGKAILSILAQDNLNVATQINWLRDYRFLDQVCKSILRTPESGEDGRWLQDDDDLYEYSAGLASCIDVDGRVRTTLYPTAETGRWKSARPNLTNVSKQRDPDYKRLLGDKYKHKLRSVLMSRPGWALVEFDYTGAELAIAAVMSGDKRMIEHTQRSLLPDRGFNEKGVKEKGGKFPHPDLYDIHSNVAVLAFRLNCAPTEKGLQSIDKEHFRTLAKNVLFGLMYGRGAKAIALQAREQKIYVTADEAQLVIDAIFSLYPKLETFMAEAERRAIEEKWLCHCFGRFRRFLSSSDSKLEGEFGRQAKNFPEQGAVASMVDRGLARLQKLIYDQGLQDDVKLLLQIHDAGLLEVRLGGDTLRYMTEELIPYAMVTCVPIYPTGLDGVPTGTGPFYLGVKIKVEHYWSESFSRAECKQHGIPLKYASE